MTGESNRSAPLPDADRATSTVRTVNGVDLHVVAAGDPEAPLVVLLHGFPEFWYGWHRCIEQFVDAGYRVLVPDQRGYNRSDKPRGVGSYRLSQLTRDVVELVHSADRETAHVVGHDWGGLVAWDLARRHPAVLDRLGIVNVPHPRVFLRTMLTNVEQFRKSWYVFFFQVPRLPEWAARRNDFQLWADALRDGASPDIITETDLDRYRRAWRRERAPTAMINWYRAMARHRDTPPRERVAVPTLVVWGENDQALIPETAPASLDYCDDGRLERFPDASHWILHERPDRVADLLVEHLRDDA